MGNGTLNQNDNELIGYLKHRTQTEREIYIPLTTCKGNMFKRLQKEAPQHGTIIN